MMKVDNNSPSFGQVSLVRVAKKAFKNPEDLKACEKEFDIQLNKARGDMIRGSKLGFWVEFIQQFLFPKSVKFITSLEGLRIRGIDTLPEKDYHSFAIYTGEDAPKILGIMSKKNGRRIGKKAAAEYTFENYMEQFSDVKRYMSPADKALCFKKYMTEQMKRGKEMLTRHIRDAFNGSKVHEFRIDSLDQIINLKNKLGF
jgi:hypothetical protein